MLKCMYNDLYIKFFWCLHTSRSVLGSALNRLRSRRQLEEELQKLDSQYDACNTVMLRGEVNGFQPEWGTQTISDTQNLC